MYKKRPQTSQTPAFFPDQPSSLTSPAGSARWATFSVLELDAKAALVPAGPTTAQPAAPFNAAAYGEAPAAPAPAATAADAPVTDTHDPRYSPSAPCPLDSIAAGLMGGSWVFSQAAAPEEAPADE